MRTKTQNLLEAVADLKFETITRLEIETLSEVAKSILEESFKEETIEVFENTLSWNTSLKDSIINNDMVGFVHESHYSPQIKFFLNANFGKVDLIIKCLKEYIEHMKEGVNNV